MSYTQAFDGFIQCLPETDPIVCVVELDECDKARVKGPHVGHVLFNP